MLFQIFRLNFSLNMSKMHCFSNTISKIVKRWGALRLQRPLTFNTVDLKLRDLAKCGFLS